MYTHGLILPTFDRNHPLASHLNCIELLKEHDPDFEDECRRAVICNMIYQHDLQSKELFEQVKSMPMALRDKYMNDLSHLSTQNVPIHSIHAKTEKMLWHQRLGHPSDKYLYRAHKFVDGVSKFKHESAVLSTCPTCIEAKQVKSAPGEQMPVAIACYGDGAANQGQIWESANMCNLWKLVSHFLLSDS